ncbi:MAG TPA: YhjD/YihY/BrkB family envelope integrity protein [Iamia sp.]|nr:YhjD/YihY/BrkB family envelope integrity protein [Iamia sp.]
MERLKALGERWPWLGTALAVHQRVGETNGGSVAQAATVQFFVALFPLILVGIAVLGFVSSGDASVSDDIIDAMGLTGSAADIVEDAIATAQDSRRAATVVGVLGLLWSGLGVTTAVSMAVRAPWQRKIEGIKTKGFGLLWLLVGALTLGGAIGSGALLNRTPEAVPRWATSIGLVLLGLALELGFFLWTFWILGDRRAGWRSFVPGAVAGALGLEVLKLVGTVLVPRMVASSSSLYGPLGAVFAILAWLTIFSRLIVYASALNAVRYEEEYGFTTLEIRAPRFEGEVPVAADRGGAVVDTEPQADHSPP